MEFDIARLIDTVDVAKAGGDAEVGGNLGEGGPDVVDVLRLGVERVVVNVLVVNAILFAASNANFLQNRIRTGRRREAARDRSYHFKPLLHWCSTLQIFSGSLDIPVDWFFRQIDHV